MTASLLEFYKQCTAALENDVRWLRDTQTMDIGAKAQLEDDVRVWENLGFVPDADAPATGTRHVRLDTTFDAVPVDCDEFEHIDCIVISTIERRNTDKQYLYDTLRSVFSTFPKGVQVNLAVGDDRAAYVSRARLVAELGVERAVQVHPFPASAEQTAALKDFTVQRRAAWNYARAIRAYRGTSGLLLLEDDVQWAQGGIQRFDYWLAGHRLPVVSLYNYDAPPWPADRTLTVANLVTHSIDEPRKIFDCTQAMYISAPVAGALGNYILLRMHDRPYDLLLDRFCAMHGLSVGHTYPSLVQHMGELTNGLGRFHQSRCFLPSLMRRETDK